MKLTNDEIEYGRACEAICTANLAFLTGTTGARFFESVTSNKEFERIDYSFIANQKQGYKKGVLELKTREININKYPALFIEPDKLTALQNAKADLKWYINFLDNQKTKFWICDISTLNRDELELKPDVKIWIKTLKQYKYEDRLLIPIEKGSYYCYDYELNKYVKREFDEKYKRFTK